MSEQDKDLGAPDGALRYSSPKTTRITPHEREALATRCKTLELQEAGRKAMAGLPLLARLDGRAFHTFTRGMQRPFDWTFCTCMTDTARSLVEEFHATVAYAQSDEITLMWNAPEGATQLPFDGRFQKLCSVLAGHASARFAQLVAERFPEKRGAIPAFDCRVWQVPSPAEALEVFIWREDDAVKNSITMLAQAHYSHKQLHKQGSADKLKMLNEKGVLWQDEPEHFKRGSYMRRVTRERGLSDEERAAIPEKFRPPREAVFLRSSVEVLKIKPIRRERNAIAMLFAGDGPQAPEGPQAVKSEQP